MKDKKCGDDIKGSVETLNAWAERAEICIDACESLSDEALSSGVVDEMVEFLRVFAKEGHSLGDMERCESILSKLEADNG